ncbi:MAG: response regulator [Desulfobacteraceae bacterium]|nr:response regulator [Desulfobacteraceae bacterium]
MDKAAVLIVDDEEMILDIIRSGLKDEDCRIITARRGEEGLEILKKNDVSLVISDQKMPGLSGTAFLKKVRQLYPDMLTIILTGYADLQLALEAINTAGVYKFMTKPINLVELRVTVRRALEFRQLLIENNRLQNKIKAYEAKLQTLEKQHPGITRVERDTDGNVLLSGAN